MLVLGIDGLDVNLALRWGVKYKYFEVFSLPKEWMEEPITLRFWLGILGCKAHLKLEDWWIYPRYLPKKFRRIYRRIKPKIINLKINPPKNIVFIYYPLIAWDLTYHLTLHKLLLRNKLDEYLKLVWIHNKYRVYKCLKIYNGKNLAFLWLDIVDHYAHLNRLGFKVKFFIKWTLKHLKPDVIISDHGTSAEGHKPIGFITVKKEDDFRRWVWR